MDVQHVVSRRQLGLNNLQPFQRALGHFAVRYELALLTGPAVPDVLLEWYGNLGAPIMLGAGTPPRPLPRIWLRLLCGIL